MKVRQCIWIDDSKLSRSFGQDTMGTIPLEYFQYNHREKARSLVETVLGKPKNHVAKVFKQVSDAKIESCEGTPISIHA